MELVETIFCLNSVSSHSSFMSGKMIKVKAILAVTAHAPSLLEFIHIFLGAIVDTSTKHSYEPTLYLLKWQKSTLKINPHYPHKNWGVFLDSGLPYRLPAACGDNTQRLLLFESSKRDYIKQKDRALTSLHIGVWDYSREMSKNDIKCGKRNFSHFLQKATRDSLRHRHPYFQVKHWAWQQKQDGNIRIAV